MVSPPPTSPPPEAPPPNAPPPQAPPPPPPIRVAGTCRGMSINNDGAFTLVRRAVRGRWSSSAWSTTYSLGRLAAAAADPTLDGKFQTVDANYLLLAAAGGGSSQTSPSSRPPSTSHCHAPAAYLRSAFWATPPRAPPRNTHVRFELGAPASALSVETPRRRRRNRPTASLSSRRRTWVAAGMR